MAAAPWSSSTKIAWSFSSSILSWRAVTALEELVVGRDGETRVDVRAHGEVREGNAYAFLGHAAQLEREGRRPTAREVLRQGHVVVVRGPAREVSLDWSEPRRLHEDVLES